MLESKLSRESIEQVRSESYEKQAKGVNYPVSRGLHTRKLQSGVTLDGYVKTLPTFRGNNVEEIISNQVARFGQATILDVGCGVGQFMLDGQRQWGDQISIQGITAHIEDPTKLIGNIDPDDIPDLQALTKTCIQKGDAQTLSDYYKVDRFNVVVSSSVANYLADPFAMIEGIYQVLAPGGVALIDYLPIDRLSHTDDAKVFRFLQSRFGMEIGMSNKFPYFDLALQKEKSVLDLPLVYDRVELICHTLCGIIPILTYKYRGRNRLHFLDFRD